MNGTEADVNINIIQTVKGSPGITNPFQVVDNLINTARTAGASSIRISGTLGNPQLLQILVNRYGATTSGATESFYDSDSAFPLVA
jgi:hypothetical protein